MLVIHQLTIGSSPEYNTLDYVDIYDAHTHSRFIKHVPDKTAREFIAVWNSMADNNELTTESAANIMWMFNISPDEV